MNSPGDSFAWPFQDPGWFGKMVVQGLIYIIPIVGWIAMYGWLLMTIDNYRAGRRELPPAGFHLARGIILFVVYLVYVIVIEIPGGILTGIGAGNHSSGLLALGYLIDAVLGLFLAFLLPAIILSTYRSGFAGGFDVAGVWATATRDPGTTVIAALLAIVAGLISGLGFILCCVGLLFTIPYSQAIIAGVITWYERRLAGPAPMPAQPA
ncbi:MAG: DUF4013 domain-containing protein [Chloroflexi bacterium]|nr:MAG: DUF4013 domain-containing protein [Chloroflexota bacterium]